MWNMSVAVHVAKSIYKMWQGASIAQHPAPTFRLYYGAAFHCGVQRLTNPGTDKIKKCRCFLRLACPQSSQHVQHTETIIAPVSRFYSPLATQLLGEPALFKPESI